MSSEFVLDPVAGIPDPPTDESQVLEWAQALTESLQRDHVANVDRTETSIMSESGLGKRPDETGSRRFYFDEKTGTLYLDSENPQGVAEWFNINNAPEYVPDGIGVHVIYSSSLPYSAGASGIFSFDEEVYDKSDYWDGGSPTEINPPSAKTYQVVFVATIDNLADTNHLLIALDIDGVSTEMNVGEFAQAASTGAGEEYELKISCLKEMNENNTLTFMWAAGATFDMSECYAVVTPMTLLGGGGATPDDSGITDHGLLSGILDDDHTQYLLASAAGGRAQFSTYWTDLTDGGETALHSHAAATICLPTGEAFQIKNTSNSCRDMVRFLSNVMYFGDDSYPMNVDGSTVHIDSGGTLTLTGTAININSESNGDIDINSTGALILDASGIVYLHSAADLIYIQDYNVALMGRIAGSATYYEMVKVGVSEGTSNHAVLGSTGLNTTVMANTVVRLGRYESKVHLQQSTGTYYQALWAEGDDLKIGTADWDKLICTFSGEINLTAGAGIRLEPGASQVITAAGILDVNDNLRLQYSDPGSHSNGDIWMESDGLHIWYAGAEKVVAGV